MTIEKLRDDIVSKALDYEQNPSEVEKEALFTAVRNYWKVRKESLKSLGSLGTILLEELERQPKPCRTCQKLTDHSSQFCSEECFDSWQTGIPVVVK